ncbi:MFS transporter [Sediminibacillus massiliensis]|uniref:MFS transporter n=1 Tax=Sediminibacillus massiliensis TaxID=1926277 RepID=UPI0009886F0C|nr:MFS transporter [Sediminibacillus massiliensis]
MSKNTLTAGALIYCAVFVASSIYVMIPLQPRLAESHNVSISYASLTSSLFICTYATGLLVFGFLADRLPLRKILVTGMAMLSLITGALIFAADVGQLILLRALQGFTAASFAPVAFGYCFRYFQGSLQGTAIALINTGFLFAGVFGQIISSYLAEAFFFSAVFTGFFLFYLICFSLLFITLKKAVPSDSIPSKKPTTIILSCFQNQILRKLYLIAFFLLLPIMLFYGSFEIYLHQVWTDFPVPLQLFRVCSLIGILPSFFISALLRRFRAKQILRFQLFVMVAGFLPAIAGLNVGTITFASFLMITSTSLTIPMVVLLVGRNTVHGTSAVAIYSFTLLSGASVGSALASLVPFPFVLGIIAAIFILLGLLAKTLPDD